MQCVWTIVDAIHQTPDLNIRFPSDHAEQCKIAKGFQNKSSVDVPNCVGAIDGIVIWTEEPSKQDCAEVQIGSGKFYCSKRAKFGFNMQAVCDSNCKFVEVWIQHPAAASDFMAFVTSNFRHRLKQPGFLAKFLSLFGDLAYVSNSYMITPYKGTQLRELHDAVNYYISQLLIRIEMAFGMLVRRWTILRMPLPASMKISR